jgi:hypothetical protein
MTSGNSGDDRGLDTPIPDWNLGSWRDVCIDLRAESASGGDGLQEVAGDKAAALK